MVSFKTMKNLCVAIGVMGFTPMAFSDILTDKGLTTAEIQCVGKTDDKVSELTIRSAFGQATADLQVCDGDKCSVLETVKLEVINPEQIQVQCATCDVASPMNIIGILQLDHANGKGNSQSYSLPAQFVRDPELWGIPVPSENALSCTFNTEQGPISKVTGAVSSSIDSLLTGTVNLTQRILSGEDSEEENSSTEESEQEQLSTPSVAAQHGLNKNLVVCIQGNGLVVRNSNLTSPLFDVYKGESLTINKSKGVKTRVLRSDRHEFVNVTFKRLGKSGWMSKSYIRAKEYCGTQSSSRSQVTPKKQDQKVTAKPKPAPSRETAPEVKADRSGSFSNSSCARSVILSATKKSVKKRWGNRSYGAGQCALGVRLSLQASGVGGISGGIGHAVDFKRRLTQFGFVDTGIRDVTKAPPGSVIVLDGPHTAKYFRTGKMSRPYGNYVGHVTIKGDDGFYYTDGRTPEVAIGWSGDRNRSKIRNVIAVMVPSDSLARSYESRCK